MSKVQIQQPNDFAIIEHCSEPRIIVSVPARYSLANRFDSNGNRREFSCRVISISPSAMTLIVPVTGAMGGRVITRCDEFGILDGEIIRVLDRGLVVKIILSDEKRSKLATKIEAYELIKNHDQPDKRRHKRLIPADPRSTIYFADNSQLECFIVDVSASGAAVSADIQPKVGMPLAVGSLVGRVVRHLENGFAIQFVRLQDIDDLEQRLLRA